MLRAEANVSSRISHVVGVDDAPFERAHRGDVRIVGAVFCGMRLEGVLCAKVRRDGVNATRALVAMLSRSRFRPQLQALLLQGVALAGFNVVDLPGLHEELGLPVIAVARRQPDFAAIRRALLNRVPGGNRKWQLIERLGPMEPAAGVFIQRVGITHERAAEVIRHFAVHSALPEPLRTAHLIAGGVTRGESRHRA